MTKLSTLKGIGEESEKCLNEIGIHTKEDLERTGTVRAYVRLKNECSIEPSLNFLYAMVGALEDRCWTDIAKTEKTRLIFELDGYFELEEILKEDGVSLKI